jgi:hypothetical protein
LHRLRPNSTQNRFFASPAPKFNPKPFFCIACAQIQPKTVFLHRLRPKQPNSAQNRFFALPAPKNNQKP